jgi:phytoene synthase
LHAGDEDAAIRTIAKDGDLDRYASALFAPRAARGRLFVLYAFNVELARIAEQVNEPQLGEIRLQWWREALARACAGEETGHPVADALGRTARACDLSKDDLLRLIDARHFDVSVKLMPAAAALDRYLDATAGTLFQLGAQIANSDGPLLAPRTADAAASAAGAAYGLTGLMRALPVHLARGRVDLPEDTLCRHGTSPEELLTGKTSDGLFATLAELRQKARAFLDQATREVSALPAEARSAFLPLALVEPYLSALEKESEPLRAIARINPLYRLWRLGTYRFR